MIGKGSSGLEVNRWGRWVKFEIKISAEREAWGVHFCRVSMNATFWSKLSEHQTQCIMLY